MMIYTAVNGFILYSDDEININEKYKIYLTNKNNSAIPCSCLKLTLKAENSFADIRKKIKLKFSGTLDKAFEYCDNTLGNHCGCITVTAKSLKIYDLLGIFFIPVRFNKTLKTNVLPKAKEPSNIPDFENITVLGFKPKVGGGFSDYYELRQYQNGDSLKSIHWKLSSKIDDLVVKEPSQPITKKFVISPQFGKNPDSNDSILARLIYMCNYFNERHMDCYAFLDNKFNIAKISNSDDISHYLYALYEKIPFNQTDIDRKNAIIFNIYEDREEVNI
ncbi:MAG: DUF58 domain-containing protein [Ruminococcus sp.]|nr:DUF58 domain-containing protein [Ruminococcus sp.]